MYLEDATIAIQNVRERAGGSVVGVGHRWAVGSEGAVELQLVRGTSERVVSVQLAQRDPE